jgi:tetratricopeptide (TPR) repeat protein/tRNA A-37 threonylcarbamoyl transferase component Bud32
MELTPEQWENVKTLFETALEKPAAERKSFLATASPDSAVRQEVERLLANYSDAGSFLSASPLGGSFAPASRAPEEVLSPGKLLAERFRVTRFLARGGMGEVYEAEDLELHERVALKTIRTERLQDPRALERFRREVHLAKQVTHPNVCRIFDLFRHQSAKTDKNDTQASVVLVAMELLEGETLADRLRRESRLRTEDALPIALQVAAGLGAAHEAGVLHRDLKPGNIVLVHSAKRLRAVITDFGLALRSSSDSSLSGAVTETGESLGTPAYMSPEQVEGHELTPASDVYSLGLVLYQMVTGTRAFEDTTPLSSAVRRLLEEPTPPHALVPDLDRRWEAVILHCLERDPKLRFQSADEVASALRGETKLPAPRRSRVWWFGAAAIPVVLLAVTGLLLMPQIRRRLNLGAANQPTAVTPVKSRPSVAVLPFRNLSGRSETDWVGTALPDVLTAELAAGEKVRTVPGESVARASADLALAGKQTLAKDTLGRLRQYLGSDFLVFGSYLDQGGGSDGQIRINLWLQDANSGDIVATVSEKGNEQQLDDLATRAGADLREKLGVGEITPKEAALAKASLPSTPEGVRLYSEGLEKLRVFDAKTARDLLEKAAAADPKSALIHSALSDAWGALGYDQKARAEAQNAYKLAAGLPREQRLWIEGRNWAANNNWDKAAQSYRSLADFFPDNIDYGLSLANALTKAGKANDALAELAALSRLSPPSNNDPRIDIQRAAAYDTLGNFPEEQAAAERAAAKAKSQGALMLLAGAQDYKVRALGNRGEWKESGSAASEAKEIYARAGDRAGIARSLRSLGTMFYEQGDYAAALKSYQESLRIDREIGNDGGAAVTLNDVANAMWAQGDWAGSEKAYEDSVQLFRKVGNQAGYAAALGNLAGIRLDHGDLAAAKKMYTEGLQLSREIGDKSGEGFALVNLAEVFAKHGNLAEAKQTYERVIPIYKASGDQSSSAYPLMGIGEVLMTQGDLNAARKEYSEALKVREQLGERATADRTKMALAELDLEQGKPATEVEGSIRSILEDFRGKNDIEGQIDARILLSRALLEQNKIEDAEKETATARETGKTNQNLQRNLEMEIATARVESASGKVDDATKRLREAMARAAKSEYVGLHLEAQLALGDVQIAAGKISAGNATLTEVRTQAQRKGYGLIVSRAKRLSRKTGSADK